MLAGGYESQCAEDYIYFPCAAARYSALFLHKSFRFRFVPLHGPNFFPSPLNAIVHE